MKKRILKVVTVSASLFIAGCVYAFLNTRFGISIPCLFYKITGFQCPGCGVTRMCISLLKLDFKAAFGHNPAVLCMLPMGLYLIFNGTKRYILSGINKVPYSENIIMIIMIAVLLIFGIVRNIF